MEERISGLKRTLDPNDFLYAPKQAKNVEAVIRLYEEGKLQIGEEVWISDGVIVQKEEFEHSTKHCFVENASSVRYQLAAKAAYGHGPYANSHELLASIRLALWAGGDGSTTNVTMMNDTGSDVMTLLDTDLMNLGNIDYYIGGRDLMSVSNASGIEELLWIHYLNVQLRTQDGEPIGRWFDEIAVLRRSYPGIVTLTGSGIRRVFWMGTSPIFDALAIAETRGGMTSLLG
ncbi:MAG: hypothetical protein LQ340_002622 [Diploschistes diacapsis]|nr:MAG: hypothetical protein LQ340_002622 [Diploschistes diacapsis]